MNLKRTARASRPQEEYFVEVDGADGLKHHVGPFATKKEAQDWISQNSPDNQLPQDEIRKRHHASLGRLIP
jgi:uncharacterized membrane protein YdbT with pleckstrin-like domain